MLQIKHKDYQLSESLLNFVFCFVWFGNLIINLDHGSVPAATKVIKRDLSLDNAQLGKLGSVVFGGLVIGSMFATVVFNKLKYKHILTVSFFGNAIGLLIVSQTKNYYWVVLGRFLSGFNQILHQVYVPVFVDAYGTSTSSKSVWMSFMLLCCPMGVIIGYEMAAIAMYYSTWQ